ncbi:MAG: hypothetical protein IPK08_15825 [Bacteroidetes bacterium]|nr:hypothetical protein [Bacteroidota bacterium]
MFFGDTQSQAQSFYLSDPDISGLNRTEWIIKPNFHVAFMESHLVWFESENKEAYLEFWKHNIELIKQQKRPAVSVYINSLISKDIIKESTSTINELDVLFYKTEKQKLNICPGFGLIYRFNSHQAESLDKAGQFKRSFLIKLEKG